MAGAVAWRSGNPAIQAETFSGVPAAFALLVTLVWLYLEILRLLAKLQSRQR